MNTTQPGQVYGPLNLRKAFSLGRNCRKNKRALNELLQERETTALEECPTTPQTEKKTQEAAELLQQQDLFSNTDPVTSPGKTLAREPKSCFQAS